MFTGQVHAQPGTATKDVTAKHKLWSRRKPAWLLGISLSAQHKYPTSMHTAQGTKPNFSGASCLIPSSACVPPRWLVGNSLAHLEQARGTDEEGPARTVLEAVSAGSQKRWRTCFLTFTLWIPLWHCWCLFK